MFYSHRPEGGENIPFPLLEAHGISGPSQVMWAIHDDIRADLKKVQWLQF